MVEFNVGARHSGIDDEVRHVIDAEFLRRRAAMIDDAAQRFQAGRAAGLAAEGFAAVCAALREGAVEMLIIGDIGDATVVRGDEVTTIAPNADVRSELGDAPRVVRADEALPMAAVATDANLVRTDERLARPTAWPRCSGTPAATTSAPKLYFHRESPRVAACENTVSALRLDHVVRVGLAVVRRLAVVAEPAVALSHRCGDALCGSVFDEHVRFGDVAHDVVENRTQRLGGR